MAIIYLGSDHGGFHLKQAIKAWLTERGESVIDMGPLRLDPDDDYPIFAGAVAQQVSVHPEDLGILACRSGQGVAIVANKYANVRAAVAWNTSTAKAARADDHANVLCLPSDELSDAAAEAIVTTWLQTQPKVEERYVRRLREIRRIEEQGVKSPHGEQMNQ